MPEQKFVRPDTPADDSGELVRVELDRRNSKLIRQLALDLDLSNTEVVNRYFHKVESVEMKEIITYKIEVRAPDRPDEPGQQEPYRKRTSFTRDW